MAKFFTDTPVGSPGSQLNARLDTGDVARDSLTFARTGYLGFIRRTEYTHADGGRHDRSEQFRVWIGLLMSKSINMLKFCQHNLMKHKIEDRRSFAEFAYNSNSNNTEFSLVMLQFFLYLSKKNWCNFTLF